MVNSVRSEVEVLVRAHYPLIYVVSYEESRAETEVLRPIANQWREGRLLSWTNTDGFAQGQESGGAKPPTSGRDPIAALDFILNYKYAALFVLKDFHPYLNDAQVVRKLRDLAAALPPTSKSVVLLSPLLRIPPELEKDVTVVDYAPPNVEELDALLTNVITAVAENPNVKIDLPPESRQRLLQAALGLTSTEAENIFAKAIVRDGSLGENDIGLILEEKKQIVRKSGLLEYFEAEERLADIGGLELLKEWLDQRSVAFAADAREFGIPEPKGVLLLGVQGCGKSLVSKAIASYWNLPLLRFDVGKVFGRYVGESEDAIRRVLKTAESVAPALLWIDEIEKGFAGSTDGASDSGVSARVLGSFLTWMQEKKAPVFVIATANNIRALPPEILRKGRFDEIFFIDLPSIEEREEIFRVHLAKKGSKPDEFDLDRLVAESEGYNGAEIGEAVTAALYSAYTEAKRSINTEDVSRSLLQMIPVSVTMKEQIEALRSWATTRARPASRAPEPVPIPSYVGRRMDL